ncbi:MAG: hypothetical protein NC038_00175 [Paludibacter sp.]|nr:hypothetical protein [Bacteroidales bacterium]MCM1068745.1 hypothetical protein [Prevotella sp.]MCM1354457.1 hypothetical protein [Bacteroides sp.]MCM1443260.1 hypothetical protein [Muribaculum sp.]MCM1481055.1 hypothetical protein [Paludibacter sp.]
MSEKIYEQMETKCSFELIDPDGSRMCKIDAEVITTSGTDKQLRLRISPDYEGKGCYELEFDQSKLPRTMVEEWIASRFATLRLIDSDLKEQEISFQSK